ncbi:LacI family DNA-binding transcriptional regulator [Prosthecomicrobium sp. N25]|uniref:LacI family DNA-binding transcriptional regulator n=1 Tax=Prosthecomicrobium sp. N25 TaxID=3129254 RepID=UPI0030786E54
MTAAKPSRKRAPSGPARIAEVAKLAGVSAATVSRALANPEKVSPEAREKVMAAVRTTGYTPNVAARNLRARKSRMVLVVVPNIGNPFFSEVLRGIDETLSAAGYGLIIGNIGQDDDEGRRFVDVAFAGQVDGVILLNGRILQARGRKLTDAATPVVAACETIPGAPIPQVEVQNREAAEAVARTLLDLGHTRFGYVEGPRANILERERGGGFRDALERAGIPKSSLVVFPGDFSFRSGSAAAERFLALAERPGAVFCANDEMAIGFVKTVRDAGLQVPRDVSVVGFDAIDFASYCEPPLTTVVQPRGAIGQKAAELLIERMRGGTSELPPHVVRFHATLRPGGSTGPAPAAGRGRPAAEALTER